MRLTGLFAKVAIAASIAWSGPCLAASIDLGTIQPGATAGSVFSHEKGWFSDTISFAVGAGGIASGQYFNFLVTGRQGSFRSNITDATLDIAGPTSFFTSLMSGGSYSFQVMPGAYTATVSGRANGALGGAYALEVAAPTPEPEAFLLIALGSGIVARSAMRRRRKASSATA